MLSSTISIREAVRPIKALSRTMLATIFLMLTIGTYMPYHGTNILKNDLARPILFAQAILPDEVHVCGLFERGEDNLEAAFKLAIERMNRDQIVLPRTKLVPHVERLDKSDSFAASKKVCNCLQKGVVTLFGPQTSKSSNYVRSISSTVQLPHFETRWDNTIQEPTSYSLNLSPHPSALGRALRDLVIKKNWKTFAILYSEDSSMVLIQEILKHSKMHTKRIMVRKAREATIGATTGSNPVSSSSNSNSLSLPNVSSSNSTSNNNNNNNNYQSQQLNDANGDLNPGQGSSTRASSHSAGAGTVMPSFREILKELAKLNVKNIIIDVPRDQVSTVLAHAQDVNMLQVYNSYIFTTLDLHTVDLRQFYHTGTNISAFSLIDANQWSVNHYDDITRDWARAGEDISANQERQQQQATAMATDNTKAVASGQEFGVPVVIQSSYQPIQQNKIIDKDSQVALMANFTTEVALTYDAIQLLAQALHDFNKTTSSSSLIRSMSNSSFALYHACSRGTNNINNLNNDLAKIDSSASSNSIMPPVWHFGSMLKMYMQMISIRGLTGDIKVNERGYRTDFKLKLHDLTREGMKSVAQWTISSGLNYVGNYSSVMTENYKELLKNKTLIVVTLESKPYIIRVLDYENKTGNDRWEGYAVDLIKELAAARNFKYILRVLPTGLASHGNRNEKGEWNGLIRELIDGKADIAVADLTITYERESVVDFTMPFMSLGIGILVKKPTKNSPKLFEFMEPLAGEVWIYLLTAFVGVTLFLFFVARFSPYEWDNPHPCELEVENLTNEFSLKNTLWFTIGCLMQQGCDIMPSSLSTRVMAAAWWFFILILVSSYTANLAAFLTVERMDNPIQSADDLAKQTKVLYGCLGHGSTRSFFQKSNYTTYARMWSFMESKRAETLLDSNSKGVERVRKGDFAFLMESTTIEYTVERNCDLSQVGSLLDQKGYGIATQQDSPYRAVLSEAILTLQESGVLHKLKDRWWKEKKEGNISCEVKEQTKSSGTASELGLDHVGGVFVVLGVGMLVALAICVGEFVWKQKKTPRDERCHILIELYRSFRYVLRAGNKRPFRRSSTEIDTDSHSRDKSFTNNTAANMALEADIVPSMFHKQLMTNQSVDSSYYYPSNEPSAPNGNTQNGGPYTGVGSNNQHNHVAPNNLGTIGTAYSLDHLSSQYSLMQSLHQQQSMDNHQSLLNNWSSLREQSVESNSDCPAVGGDNQIDPQFLYFLQQQQQHQLQQQQQQQQQLRYQQMTTNSGQDNNSDGNNRKRKM